MNKIFKSDSNEAILWGLLFLNLYGQSQTS